MIAESTEVSFFGRVDKFAFVEGHEVEVLDAFLVILVHAASKSGFRDDFADIFKNEYIGVQIFVSA